MPPLVVLLGAVVLLAAGSAVGWAGGAPAEETPAALPALPAVSAAPGVTVDTLFVGGFARGSFREALATLASDLSPGEREAVGRHLDRIYEPLLDDRGMERGGRLRLAYERTRGPDGDTRAIQVLAAEAAVAGRMHTVFLFEGGAGAGYFDDLGRSLDARPWETPLARMRVTSPFRMDRMHPVLRRVLPHTGVDLAAAEGTPVVATADGVVSHAGPRGGYGEMVELRHPSGYVTRYAHLSRIPPEVRPGAAVRQGERIGWSGSTGRVTGPHLHYEVRRRGRPIDPLSVSPADGPTADVGYEAGWRDQRRRLARLLARAPTVVSAR